MREGNLGPLWGSHHHLRRTSREAYRVIQEEGLLGQAKRDCYDLLYRRGPLTAGQVASLAREEAGNASHARGETIRKRLSELKDLGLVHEMDVVLCPLTGHEAILWDVTDKVPERDLRDDKESAAKARIEKRYAAAVERRRRLLRGVEKITETVMKLWAQLHPVEEVVVPEAWREHVELALKTPLTLEQVVEQADGKSLELGLPAPGMTAGLPSDLEGPK